MPNNPYGITKLASEHLLETYHQENGLKYNALRFMNVYGPRQNPNSEYAAVIPIFIKKALKNQDLIIYGDGKQTRDFIYAKDVVSGVIKSMDKGQGIYNIGKGEKSSINKLAKTIIKNINPKLKIKYSKERSEGVRDSVSDISKAVKELNWKPLTDLNQGLKETINYNKR